MNEPEKRLDVLIAENTCPKCGAGPGRRCQTPSGKFRDPHGERWRTMTPEQDKRTTWPADHPRVRAAFQQTIDQRIFKSL